MQVERGEFMSEIGEKINFTTWMKIMCIIHLSDSLSMTNLFICFKAKDDEHHQVWHLSLKTCHKLYCATDEKTVKYYIIEGGQGVGC